MDDGRIKFFLLADYRKDLSTTGIKISGIKVRSAAMKWFFEATMKRTNLSFLEYTLRIEATFLCES
jgi:hypothetical protein